MALGSTSDPESIDKVSAAVSVVGRMIISSADEAVDADAADDAADDAVETALIVSAVPTNLLNKTLKHILAVTYYL